MAFLTESTRISESTDNCCIIILCCSQVLLIFTNISYASYKATTSFFFLFQLASLKRLISVFLITCQNIQITKEWILPLIVVQQSPPTVWFSPIMHFLVISIGSPLSCNLKGNFEIITLMLVELCNSSIWSMFSMALRHVTKNSENEFKAIFFFWLYFRPFECILHQSCHNFSSFPNLSYNSLIASA